MKYLIVALVVVFMAGCKVKPDHCTNGHGKDCQANGDGDESIATLAEVEPAPSPTPEAVEPWDAACTTGQVQKNGAHFGEAGNSVYVCDSVNTVPIRMYVGFYDDNTASWRDERIGGADRHLELDSYEPNDHCLVRGRLDGGDNVNFGVVTVIGGALYSVNTLNYLVGTNAGVLFNCALQNNYVPVP